MFDYAPTGDLGFLSTDWLMVLTALSVPEDLPGREQIVSQTSSLFSPESARTFWHPGKKDSGPDCGMATRAEGKTAVGGEGGGGGKGRLARLVFVH